MAETLLLQFRNMQGSCTTPSRKWGCKNSLISFANISPNIPMQIFFQIFRVFVSISPLLITGSNIQPPIRLWCEFPTWLHSAQLFKWFLSISNFLLFSLQSGFDAESFCRFTTCVHSVQLLELWKKQARHQARRMCKTHCASKACLNFPSNSLLAMHLC